MLKSVDWISKFLVYLFDRSEDAKISLKFGSTVIKSDGEMESIAIIWKVSGKEYIGHDTHIKY